MDAPTSQVMHPLHITKVAFGCESADILAERLGSRAEAGETSITTRFRPTRADELVGGSLFWILKHRLVARSTILGFAETAAEGEQGARRCLIRLDARLIPVRAVPRRAHQGWRYLIGADAPADFGEGAEAEQLALMPRHLVDELAALALI